MKNILSIMFLLALLASGCSQEELVTNQSAPTHSPKFTASFEQDESRTYIEKGKLLRWVANDQISLFIGNTLNSLYQFDGETGDNSGTFSAVDNPFATGADLLCNYAVYPYAKNIKISDDLDEPIQITATLPAEQSYAENSFGPGANTMVAVTKDKDDTYLKFKNVCGYLKLQLYGEDVTVKSITLTGNNEEKIAGKATIIPAYGTDPSVSMTVDATETITLVCEEGVKLGTTAEEATEFWMVVPPISFENGFTITIKDENDFVFTQSTSNKIIIERNIIRPMAAIKVNPGIPYLTFTAGAEQTLTLSKAVATLEYSVNGSEWTELGTNTVTFGGEHGTLLVRGQSAIGTANNTDDTSTFIFGNDTKVACTGDIRTLVDYENHTIVLTNNAKYCNLFKDCTQLISAPELPATLLAESCYWRMFIGCSSLKKAPELPATKLTDDCYGGMFESCTNLKTAPELPATKLAFCCYGAMFAFCFNLETAPELPATTSADWCYSHMFTGCTNLTSAPTTLPATTLAGGCYSNMFRDCHSLTTAPELPATNLAEICYVSMFENCTSLRTAPPLPATTLAESCYESMFKNCTSLISAPKLPATTLVDGCYKEMFMNCESLKTAPALPATTLVNYCYAGMFAGTDFTTAPVLPATTLAEGCYCSMFDSNSNLNQVTMLATEISAEKCLDNWLNGVSSTGTFTKAAEMESLTTGVSGIPEGWTIINNED